jgi:hypothetical protein
MFEVWNEPNGGFFTPPGATTSEEKVGHCTHTPPPPHTHTHTHTHATFTHATFTHATFTPTHMHTHAHTHARAHTHMVLIHNTRAHTHTHTHTQNGAAHTTTTITLNPSPRRIITLNNNQLLPYLALYKATADAIKNASSGRFKVGGPATAGCPGWISQLVAFAEANNTALDFVSCHAYGGGAEEGPSGSVNGVVGPLPSARSAAGKLPVVLTEWSSSWMCVAPPPFVNSGSVPPLHSILFYSVVRCYARLSKSCSCPPPPFVNSDSVSIFSIVFFTMFFSLLMPCA